MARPKLNKARTVERTAPESEKPAAAAKTSVEGIFAPLDRSDWMRAATLTVLTALIWCLLYNRWTAESWQTPVDYLSDIQKSDAIGFMANFKAAGEGEILPFMFTYVPQLGAPGVANWNDFPFTEKPEYLLPGLLGDIFGLFAGANIAVMLASVLAAVAFYVVCRVLDVRWEWAFAGGITFAFARYIFAHGLHHLPVTYYWHLPLGLLVCEWVMRGEGIKWGERRFGFALAIAFITGVQNIYYTFLFGQLVIFGGLVQAWQRGWRHLWPAAAIAATSLAAIFLMDCNTILYGLIYGHGSAIVRDYKWMEVYGLKLVDLVIPPPDHPFPPFAAWGAQHVGEVILSPGELPPTAYLGLLGLAAMGWLVLLSLRRGLLRTSLPLETYWILWIILFATVGGINGILATLGLQEFRAATRYSIVILCIVLMFAVRRLSLVRFPHPALVPGLAALAAIFAVWDQSPPIVSDSQLKELQQQVASDRTFTEDMVHALPHGAMVFQLPAMYYPESPAAGMPPYDHLRPYLYTDDLRFSFGSDKGRPDTDWQEQVVQEPLDQVISDLQGKGFAALYINRNGFQDKAEGLIKALHDRGYTQTIESARGDLVCVILKKA
jgi:phosphoglycerol transferase